MSNHLPYVIAAYSVFVVVLAWDFLAPRLQLRRILRQAQLRSKRRQPAPAPSLQELER